MGCVWSKPFRATFMTKGGYQDDDSILEDVEDVMLEEAVNELITKPPTQSEIMECSNVCRVNLRNFMEGLNLQLSFALPIEFALRCLCNAAICYTDSTDIGQWVGTLLRSDFRTLENGISVLRSKDLKTASDALEEVVGRVPLLIDLKEKDEKLYQNEAVHFQNLVYALSQSARDAFNSVEHSMDQIRAVELHCIALTLSAATGDRDVNIVRSDLGALMHKLFSLPRLQDDIQQVLQGKIRMLDSTTNVKARLTAAMYCLLHVEKFNLSNNLPFVYNEVIKPQFPLKTVLESGLLGSTSVKAIRASNEYSDQEMMVIEALMGTKEDIPALPPAVAPITTDAIEKVPADPILPADARRKLKRTDADIHQAVKDYYDDPVKAKEKWGDIRFWDTSDVTNMKELFRYMENFNEDISKWDVSKVTDMTCMFYYASSFNQDISKWDVSNVTNMNCMFCDASSFNQDIGKWDVSKVTNMSYMFNNAGAIAMTYDTSKFRK